MQLPTLAGILSLAALGAAQFTMTTTACVNGTFPPPKPAMNAVP
jgi:hypothetical protein